MKLKNIEIHKMMFKDTIVKRGQEYFEGEFVEFNCQINNKLYFKVEGNMVDYYDVVVEMRDDTLESISCNCPFEGNCKHNYAVLLYLEDFEVEKNPGYLEEIKKQNKEELLNDLLFLYNKYDCVVDYYNTKYNKDIEFDSLLKLFEKIKEEFDDAYDEVDYLDYDDLMYSNKFYEEHEYGDTHFYVNDDYFEEQLRTILNDIIIYLTNRYNSKSLIQLFEYLSTLYDDLTYIFVNQLTKFIISIKEKIDDETLFITLLNFDKLNEENIFLVLCNLIDDNNYSYFYDVFTKSCCAENAFLFKYEELIVKYYPDLLIDFYFKYINKNDYYIKYINIFINTKNINNFDMIIDKLLDHQKKEVYELLFDYCIDNKINAVKYALLSLTKNNIDKVYNYVKDKDKELNDFLVLVDKEIDSVTLLNFYYNNDLEFKAINLIKKNLHLLVYRFDKIYSYDNEFALNSFQSYIDDLVSSSNKNYEYENIRICFEKCYQYRSKDFFINYADDIIKNTKKRNLKAQLKDFLLDK